MTFKLDLGDPVPVEELLAKPEKASVTNPRDIALDELVAEVNLPANADKAYPWRYSPEKLVTARAAAIRAVKRNGLDGKVFVSTKGDLLYFSQKPLSNRGRKRK